VQNFYANNRGGEGQGGPKPVGDGGVGLMLRACRD